ncbi:LGFP repeat-containing protein [Corynebacterium sp.]|uniref:LGFP repeat-containing protein n=1 Tax=Corynebacterium sp. TaxID=1720 RepID=UPI0026DD439F|nr:hypothetical protein [Corynebacterium sp.]MDO5032812.1 hypothetical protein [Corynebacterium sp.]
MTRRFAAGIAAASLSLGLVACSNAEDAANEAGDAAKSAGAEATEMAGSAANEATEAAGSAAADASDAMKGDGSEESEGAEGSGEMTTISTAGGDVEVPADFASAIEEKSGEWGEVSEVESTDKGSVATFAEDKLLAYSEENGAQPIIGKIAETWTNEGGLDSEVGLPKAPEQSEGTGWTQEFDNGTISWMQGESGQYEPTIK